MKKTRPFMFVAIALGLCALACGDAKPPHSPRVADAADQLGSFDLD